MGLKQKSIKQNAILNVIRVIGTLVIPLFLTPYVARVLGVVNMGKINFSNSIVSYFSLVASLGVSAYAIREGASIRESRNKMGLFASEILRLNIFSTVVASVLLLILLNIAPNIKCYSKIILMQALNIIFVTFGVEWICVIYEDYIYVTLRTIIIQITSLVFILVFVKNPTHLYRYLLINLFAGLMVNLFNRFRSKKYCEIHVTRVNINKEHIKPILYIFFSTVASTIYTNIDITMLGIINGDYQVGIYSMAVKICSIIKQLIFAGIDVTMPRLSYLIKNDKLKYDNLLNSLVHVAFILVVPLISGAIIERKQIIWLVLGDEYGSSDKALMILLVAVFFASMAYFVMHTMLLPYGLENILFKGTLVGALLNLLLNLVAIPILGIEGAAITTVLSEATVFIVCYWHVRNIVHIQINKMICMTTIVADIVMIIFILLLKRFIHNNLIEIIISVGGGSIIYFGIIKTRGISIKDYLG